MLAACCALLFGFPHGMLEDVQAVGGSMLLDATTASATEPAAAFAAADACVVPVVAAAEALTLHIDHSGEVLTAISGRSPNEAGAPRRRQGCCAAAKSVTAKRLHTLLDESRMVVQRLTHTTSIYNRHACRGCR